MQSHCDIIVLPLLWLLCVRFSGVLLLDLGAMRHSTLYNSLLNEETLEELSNKYRFKGHLGDQDFFTLISLEREGLFYALPCGWNRQLCSWWKNHGYESVFDLYYECPGPIHILHGNCNTRIPDDWLSYFFCLCSPSCLLRYLLSVLLTTVTMLAVHAIICYIFLLLK